MSFENGVLEGSWVDLGAPRPRFWSLQASILEPPASILKPPGSIVEPPGLQPSFAYASHIQQHHLANVGQSLAWGSFLLCFCLPQQPCQSVGGGGVPPWGPSMESTPKPSKINVPKNMRFFTDFCSKNVLLRKRRHQFRIGFYSVFCLLDTFLRFAVRMHFGSEKLTKNASKTRVEPFKNRCQKRVVLQH